MALAGSIVRYRPRREVVGRFRADKNGVTVRMKTRRLQRMVDEWMQRDVATPSSPPEGALRRLREGRPGLRPDQKLKGSGEAFTNPLENLETGGAIHKASWGCLGPFRKEVISDHNQRGPISVWR